MKGIILAGGEGSRLYPLTLSISKQLLPVHDKPMIFYPLSVLMLAGIKDILIISNKENLNKFKLLFKTGSHLGISITYKIQAKPEGIAQALVLGKQFIKNDPVCLILGDNIFYGSDLVKNLNFAINNISEYASLFAYQVSNPSSYGVIKYNKKNQPVKIIEKPKKYVGNYAVTGIYFYPKGVSKIAKQIKKSKRGEFEITSLNNYYLKAKKIKIIKLGRGFAWLDTGTHEDLSEASSFIYTIEKRQGLKIACLEEIALNYNWINKQDIIQAIKFYGKCVYSNYLKKIIE